MPRSKGGAFLEGFFRRGSQVLEQKLQERQKIAAEEREVEAEKEREERLFTQRREERRDIEAEEVAAEEAKAGREFKRGAGITLEEFFAGTPIPEEGGPFTAFAREQAEFEAGLGVTSAGETRAAEIKAERAAGPPPMTPFETAQLELQKLRQRLDFHTETAELAREEWGQMVDREQRERKFPGGLSQYVDFRTIQRAGQMGMDLGKDFVVSQPGEIVQQNYIDIIDKATTPADARASIEAVQIDRAGPIPDQTVEQAFTMKFGVSRELNVLERLIMLPSRNLPAPGPAGEGGFVVPSRLAERITGRDVGPQRVQLGELGAGGKALLTGFGLAGPFPGAFSVLRGTNQPGATLLDIHAQGVVDFVDLIEGIRVFVERGKQQVAIANVPLGGPTHKTQAQVDAEALLQQSEDPKHQELANEFLAGQLELDEFYARYPAGFGPEGDIVFPVQGQTP
jgi:hypothetical protein